MLCAKKGFLWAYLLALLPLPELAKAEPNQCPSSSTRGRNYIRRPWRWGHIPSCSISSGSAASRTTPSLDLGSSCGLKRSPRRWWNRPSAWKGKLDIGLRLSRLPSRRHHSTRRRAGLVLGRRSPCEQENNSGKWRHCLLNDLIRLRIFTFDRAFKGTGHVSKECLSRRFLTTAQFKGKLWLNNS